MFNFVQRFKEPSSWAGVAILINLLAGAFGLPPGIGEGVVTAGSAIAGVAAIILAEKAKGA